MMENSTEVMTVKEVAEYLKTCPMTIYRMVKDGEIPSFKIGADWRFRKEAIMNWILSKENNNGNGKQKKNNKIELKAIDVVGVSKN